VTASGQDALQVNLELRLLGGGGCLLGSKLLRQMIVWQGGM